MLLKVHIVNPSPKHLKIILETLKKGKLIIYPTDTVYGIGCDMHNSKAIENLCHVLGKRPERSNLSIICSNLSNISYYTVPFETSIYKLMRKALPGPYTFILNANSNVPRIFKRNKKTIGIRVPDSNLVREMVEEYGNPIVTASIKDTGNEVSEYLTDPQQIHNIYEHKVGLVINGGAGGNVPSTVLDCTKEKIVVAREGKGDISILN